MNLRNQLLDILETPPYGKPFDDLKYELDVSDVQLEALLRNLRRDKIVKPYDGRWYLQTQPIVAAVKAAAANKAKADEVSLNEQIRELRRTMSAYANGLRRLRKSFERAQTAVAQLQTELDAIEQHIRSDS